VGRKLLGCSNRAVEDARCLHERPSRGQKLASERAQQDRIGTTLCACDKAAQAARLGGKLGWGERIADFFGNELDGVRQGVSSFVPDREVIIPTSVCAVRAA
jgi:hypothetical protein